MDDQNQIRKVAMVKEKAKKWTNQPVLVKWGLAVLFLFSGFAVTSQVQNSNNNSDRVHDAEVATQVAQQAADEARAAAYEAQKASFRTAHKDWSDCRDSVKTRDSLRVIFFAITHEPVSLFPVSEAAQAYENQLNDLIENGFKAKKAADCGVEPVAPIPPDIPTTTTQG